MGLGSSLALPVGLLMAAGVSLASRSEGDSIVLCGFWLLGGVSAPLEALMVVCIVVLARALLGLGCCGSRLHCKSLGGTKHLLIRYHLAYTKITPKIQPQPNTLNKTPKP